MDDLITEFLTETNESLEELDLDLVNLENNPNDKDLLSKIFRIMHTIKGTCGFLSLPRLETVAHKAEDVLGLFRDGTLQVTEEYVTLIFSSLDRIKFIIGEIEATGSEPEGDDSELLQDLAAVYESANGEQSALDELEAAFAAAPGPDDVAATDAAAEDEGAEEESAADTDMADIADFKPVPVVVNVKPQEEEKPAAPTLDEIEAKAQSLTNKKPEAPTAEKDTTAKKSSVASQSLRVNVDVLENLMTMVSELVLTRNQLLQIMRMQSETEFSGPLQRLNHVVSDLQEGVMKTRMQPIGNAWAKLPRIVRDISLELGKKIDLEMLGQDTELDRQVLDLIKDPLTHMVRNSADHGIEKPEDRVALGKPEAGKILLNSYHEGGHIIIEISDDGKGLSVDKIKQKAIDNNLATAAELEDMSVQQINQFIFKAGFSTAEKVTAVSGRGVGMDVVRSNIEKIGGSIELNSVEGKGSRFLIKIPLTLAIVSALIVEAAGEKFAIPQLAVKELVMVSETGDNRIEMIKGTPVFRLRDHLLPLIPLQKLLKLGDEAKPETTAEIIDMPLATGAKSDQYDAHKDEDEAAEAIETAEAAEAKKASVDVLVGRQHAAHRFRQQYIVVTQVGSYQFGIIVNRVFDTEEIVVKPVARILKDIEIFSGNTILGDGSVIMILDPAGIAKSTGELETADSDKAAKQAEQEHLEHEDKTSLLLFRAGDVAPKAVPLELVSRLEEVKMSDVEHANGNMVVQYRGQLMPLIPFNSNVKFPNEGRKPVLVFSNDHRSLGIIVDEIVDITEDVINVEIETGSQGVVGSAIIDEKATDVIDVGYFIRQISKDWFKDHDDTPFDEAAHAGEPGAAGQKKILLVEDSPFFRNMLTPLLKVAGYDVTAAENAIAALKLCEKGAEFDVIVSDIEMPGLDGYELAFETQNEPSLSNSYVILHTSLSTRLLR